jgi:hypothetical protein
MKPTGIMDYVAPWFIPLFCFFAGYFLNTVIEVRINSVTGFWNHENYYRDLSQLWDYSDQG